MTKTHRPVPQLQGRAWEGNQDEKWTEALYHREVTSAVVSELSMGRDCGVPPPAVMNTYKASPRLRWSPGAETSEGSCAQRKEVMCLETMETHARSFPAGHLHPSHVPIPRTRKVKHRKGRHPTVPDTCHQ